MRWPLRILTYRGRGGRRSPTRRSGLIFLGGGKEGRSARRELLVGATALSQLAFWLANLAIQNSRDDQGDRSLLRFASPARRSTSLAHCCSRMLSSGYSERQEIASASIEAKATGRGERQFRPPAERALPISPGQLSYETPALSGQPAPLPEALSSPSPPPERVEELAAVQPVEVLRVRANAIIRNGPSTKAKKIGAVTPGTALQVKAREGGWVQFVNSSSGVEGWIHSSLVGLTPESGTTSSAITRADAPASMPLRPKVAKKRIKQKPSASIQASKHRHYRPDPPVPIRSPSGFFSRRGGMALGPSER